VTLEQLRAYACRLEPEQALGTLDDAEAFLRDRGLLTRMPCCSLPSLFGACHEEPYRPGGRGFGSWPKTKWPWSFELATRPGVHMAAIHRGKSLYFTDEVARLADPLCRAELARADEGGYGEDARRLVAHLREAGPSTADDLKVELDLGSRDLRAARERLARVGALLTRPIYEPEEFSVVLERWDQRFPEPTPGGLDELLAAAVRAAVVAPERELGTWFSWPLPRGTVDRLVEDGRLAREGGAVYPVR